MIIYLSVFSFIPEAVDKKKYISSSASTLEVKCMQMRIEDFELSLDRIKLLVITL